MEGVDSYDQEVIVIPIRDKTRDPSPAAIGCRTENGVTVISIEKSKNVVCEICSNTLKSMKYLERHMKSVHRDTCFYCSVYFHVVRQKNLDSSHVIWLGNKWQCKGHFHSSYENVRYNPVTAVVITLLDFQNLYVISCNTFGDIFHTNDTAFIKKY